MTYFSRPVPADAEACAIAGAILRWVSVDTSLIHMLVKRRPGAPILALADAFKLLAELFDPPRD
jgi:hypothetical protein